MSSPIVVATIALQGVSVGVSGELAVRNLFLKRDKASSVRIGKFFLGFSMAIKTIFFLSFNSNLGISCYALGRIADLFYHLAMTAGTHVLVTRVQSIVPIEWKLRTLYFHSGIALLRFIIGCVDVGLIKISAYPDGTCEYVDNEYWGPVYTLYDTVIDLYVTIVISAILISHIRSLAADRMKVNTVLYTSVIYHNVTRTVCLTIVNLISAIFIIMRNQVAVIMLLWPIINIFFVVLVGYDSDVTKSIRKLSQKRWRTISNITSTIDLGGLPTISQQQAPNMKRPLSTRSNSELQQCPHAHNESVDGYDLSSIHIERFKSSSTEHQIQQDNRLFLPKSTTPSTSYDTDNTLT